MIPGILWYQVWLPNSYLPSTLVCHLHEQWPGLLSLAFPHYQVESVAWVLNNYRVQRSSVASRCYEKQKYNKKLDVLQAWEDCRRSSVWRMNRIGESRRVKNTFSQQLAQSWKWKKWHEWCLRRNIILPGVATCLSLEGKLLRSAPILQCCILSWKYSIYFGVSSSKHWWLCRHWGIQWEMSQRVLLFLEPRRVFSFPGRDKDLQLCRGNDCKIWKQTAHWSTILTRALPARTGELRTA